MQSFSCLDQCPSEQQCYLESVQKEKKRAWVFFEQKSFAKHKGIGGIRGPVTNKSI